MAYDVIKRIGGREYRYRVQSERDPDSGKPRNRWTYVGRVSSERTPASPARPARSDTQLRVLEALERLLDRGDPKAITAGAIAAEAGIAHGTFYRYFKDRTAALEAFARHFRATRGIAEENLRDDVATVGEARARLRQWNVEKLRTAVERPASLRVWYALMASDVRLAAFRIERRAATLARLSGYLTHLAACGFAPLPDPEATAAALFAMIDGLTRGAIVDAEQLDERRTSAAADVAERAVFGA
ncbi:MAG: hypothetical protein NVSMB64_15790 [Candidatus Velthaea sp.]